MKELFKSIYGRFQIAGGSTPAFYTAIGGRMYLEEAPQNTSYPNCVFGLVNNSASWDFTEDYDEALVDFVIYSSAVGASSIMGIESQLRTLYDDCGFASTDIGATWKQVYMHRGNSWLDKIPDAVSGKSIWRYTVEYNVLLTK